MNINNERIRLTIYNCRFILITQTILVFLLKSLISSGRLDMQIYFFGYFPVVLKAIVSYRRSRY